MTYLEKKIEEMGLKVHRNSNEHLKFQEQLGDFDTKMILLIQAAKNSAEGKDVSHLFDGLGDVISAVDHFKEIMKGQYARLAEFKEIENSVESLIRFKSDYMDTKRQRDKDSEELMDRFEDTIRTCEKLRHDVQHIKEDKIRVVENQMIEKVDHSEFEATVQNIQAYLENIGGDMERSGVRKQRTFNDFEDDDSNKNTMRMSQSSIPEVDDDHSDSKKSYAPDSSKKSSPKNSRKQSQTSISPSSK